MPPLPSTALPTSRNTSPAAHAPDAQAMPWYVCLTKPRQEAYAVVKLQEQGYEVYLPLLVSWARLAGAWQAKQSVMFPRYGFVRPAHRDHAIGPVRSTPGVTTLVRFGHILACLSAERVEALRSVVTSRAAAMPEQPFEPGKHVVFSSGALKGLTGIVSSVASERVLVLMSLLGREKIVAVRADDLSRATEFA